MKEVLWVSQHAPLACQKAELRRLFGDDCEVVHWAATNSVEVAEEFRRGGYADIVCVIPLATLDHFCREGLRPLWADMVESAPADGREPDLQFCGKRFWFTGFRRVTGVGLQLEPVGETAGVQTLLRVTRHRLEAEERAILRSTFGAAARIIEDARPMRDGRDIIERMRAFGAQEVLIVAPYSVYDQLVRAGVKPLYGKMEGGRFHSLHRVFGVRVDFEAV